MVENLKEFCGDFTFFSHPFFVFLNLPFLCLAKQDCQRESTFLFLSSLLSPDVPSPFSLLPFPTNSVPSIMQIYLDISVPWERYQDHFFLFFSSLLAFVFNSASFDHVYLFIYLFIQNAECSPDLPLPTPTRSKEKEEWWEIKLLGLRISPLLGNIGKANQSGISSNKEKGKKKQMRSRGLGFFPFYFFFLLP